MTDDLYLAIVRRRIQAARLARQLRQEDVAERLGISVRAYQRYEGDETAKDFNPYVLTLRKIAGTLSEDTGKLLREPSQAEIQALERPARPRRAPKRGK